MWKDFNTRFGGILKSLSRHKDLVKFRANVAQYLRYQEDIADLKAKLNETIAKEQAKKMMIVKDWLAVGEQQQKDHDNFTRVRKECATTARWVLRHETVNHWMDADVPNTPTVWMHGIPGAGEQYSRWCVSYGSNTKSARLSLRPPSSTNVDSEKTSFLVIFTVTTATRQAIPQSAY